MARAGGCFDRNYTSVYSFKECIREEALGQMRYMSPTQAAVFTFIYACISLLGALGNGLVIFAVARRPEMRTTRNVFIVNLALSNFLLALILVPFLWLPTYRIEFPYGAFMCKVANAFPSTNIFCSTLTVSVIAVDRYYVVVRARLGPGKVKTTQAILIASAIWIISFSLSILYLLHFDTNHYDLPSGILPANLERESRAESKRNPIVLFTRCELLPKSCVHMQDAKMKADDVEACYKFYETALSALSAVFIYFVPMPVLVVFSCLLSRFLASNQRQHSALRHRVCLPLAAAGAGLTDSSVRNNTLGAALMTAANSVIGRQNANPNSRSATDLTTAAFRRRSRTTSLLFAMAFSNALLWLPFIVVSMIIQLAPREVTRAYQDALRQLDDAAKLISMLSICVNPFLYGYLNTNFNREFKIIFGHCCPWIVNGTSYSSSGRSTSMMLSLRSSQQGRSCGVQATKAIEIESNSASAFADQAVNPVGTPMVVKQCSLDNNGDNGVSKPLLRRANTTSSGSPKAKR